MVSKKRGEPSPTSLARAERQRVAAEEGARAMADADRNSAAVRTNMERLRALRQAREAEDAIKQAELPPAAKKKRKASAKRKVGPGRAS
jgi:hypothetical protein